MPVTIKKSGQVVGTRDIINVLDGANIANNLTDDAIAGEIDWQIVNTGTGASGGGPQLLVAAEGSVSATVYNRADYKVTTANNASTGVGNTALTTITNALVEAGDGGSVKFVGQFYLTNKLNMNAYERMLIHGEGWNSIFSPADNFPTGTALIEMGQAASGEPNNWIYNLTLDGRQSAFRTGSTINKTIDGIWYGSYIGRLFRVNAVRFTGVGFLLYEGATEVNKLTDAIMSECLAACNLGGGMYIRAPDMYISLNQYIRNGYDTDDWLTFTKILDNIPGVYGNFTSIQWTGNDFSYNTGIGCHHSQLGSVRAKFVACGFSHNGTATSTTHGGLVTTSGTSPGQWDLDGCVFQGGRGKQLDITDMQRGVLAGCVFSGYGEDGVTATASKAIEATSADNTAFSACAIEPAGYTGTVVTIPSGNGNRINGFTGIVTENSGSEVITSTTDSTRVVSHGLGMTPVGQDISITPQFNIGTSGRFWVSTVTATQFTIHWAGLGATGTVGWQAEIGLA